MVTQRAYKFRLYPTSAQKRQLAIEFGHARFVWNWALETRTKAYQEHKERLNYSALSRQLTVLKKEHCPWLSEASAGCHTQKLIDQDKALRRNTWTYSDPPARLRSVESRRARGLN